MQRCTTSIDGRHGDAFARIFLQHLLDQDLQRVAGFQVGFGVPTCGNASSQESRVFARAVETLLGWRRQQSARLTITGPGHRTL